MLWTANPKMIHNSSFSGSDSTTGVIFCLFIINFLCLFIINLICCGGT